MLIKTGAVLYIGASSDDSDREYLAKHFPSMKEYILQRNAIIAIHELDFGEVIEKNVKPSVRADLDGTYKRLREDHRGKYFVLLDKLSYKKIYDEVSNYE